MAIQVSTVASESAFSAAGRVVDPYRSRLDPEMVEALICTKDWVAAARKDSNIVGSIVSDLEVETLPAAMVNKLRLEEEIEGHIDGIENDDEGHIDGMEEEIEDEDMDSDPNIMNGLMSCRSVLFCSSILLILVHVFVLVDLVNC